MVKHFPVNGSVKQECADSENCAQQHTSEKIEFTFKD